MSKFIWLIGENLGTTANNNSYWFWKNIVDKDDDIEKYYVLSKNKKNMEFYKNLPESQQKYIVWKNTEHHLKMFFAADMYFVTLSYRDIRPERLFGKKIAPNIHKPLIYLQHGTLAMKVIDYSGRSFNNNLFRFVYYNKLIKDDFISKNRFRDYQMYYGEYHPRYIESVRRFREYKADRKRILWFPTWREYLGDNPETDELFRQFRDVLLSPAMKTYLEENDAELTFCVHAFFDKEKLQKLIPPQLRGEMSDRINIVHAQNTDVMGQLAECSLLITDYSSVGFDVTLLGKPVVLYQPDIDVYLQGRELYCTIDELNEYNIKTSDELVNTVVNETYTVNRFFRSRLPENIDLDYILSGGHIDIMYEDFARIQRNKITFIGYNFFGIGGTVFATRSLAEGLMEKGYMVELLSLKRNRKPQNPPCGLSFNYTYVANHFDIVNTFKRHFYRRKKLFSYLTYDRDIVNLKPYSGLKLTKILNTTKSRTVISTRESLHLFLNAAQSDMIKNKIYFFHCPVEIFEEVFPGILPELNKCDIEKAVFVTENNRKKYIEQFGFDNYKKHIVLGNCLESSRSVEREDITSAEKKDVYRGIYLLRLSEDRKLDIDNLIKYGCYLRDNNVKGIVIDVYGEGNYKNQFKSMLAEEGLTEYICYKGVAKDGPAEIRKHDAVVDFSLNHSFGMPYIEGVMNGKPVFCEKNEGSLEVMEKIPSAFITTHEELTEKLLALDEISSDTLKENYDIISEKYSRQALAQRILDFIDE